MSRLKPGPTVSVFVKLLGEASGPGNTMQSARKREILFFRTAAEFRKWLGENHRQADGIWLRISKKNSAEPSVTYAEALDIALCFGWIDGQKRSHDDSSWLQRFTPRGPRSKWSQINRDKAQELVADGRMRPAGQAQVDAARGDGRWEAAYQPQSSAT